MNTFAGKTLFESTVTREPLDFWNGAGVFQHTKSILDFCFPNNGMLQDKPPLSPRVRRAYHEAGHAAIAQRFNVSIHHVALPTLKRPAARSQFESLSDYCRLYPGRPANLALVDQYVVFLLSGSVAEMIAVENHREIVPCSLEQEAFRARWYDTAWFRPEAHLDLAYYTLVAWLPTELSHALPQRNKSLWLRTIRLLREPCAWSGVQRIAARLLADESLDLAAVARAMAASND